MTQSEPCGTQKIWTFIRKPIISGTLLCAFASIIFVLPFVYFNTPDMFYVDKTSAQNILEMMNNSFIALFGFVGLIITFSFKNLLDKKDLIEKSRMEIDLKKLESGQTFYGTTPTIHEARRLEKLIEKYDEKDREIEAKLNQMKNNIKKAGFYGSSAIGFSIGCLIFNFCSLGFIINKGLHVYFLFILMFLFIENLMITMITVSIILE